MKFEFKNFGRAGEGVIELNDLTVICGPNNTGKTYLNYAVFSIFNRIRDYFDISIGSGDLEKALEDLTNKGKCELEISEKALNEERLIMDIGKRVSSDLHEFFGLPDNHFTNLKMSLILNEFGYKNASANGLFVLPGMNGSIRYKNGTIVTLEIEDDDNQEFVECFKIDSEKLRKILEELLFNEIIAKHVEFPYSITSERTGIALFYKTFDERNSRIIRNLNGKKSEMSISDLINSRADLSLPIHENIVAVRNYGSLTNHKSKFVQSPEKFEGVLTLLSDLLDGGEFSSMNDTVLYVPNRNLSVPEPPTPLHAASSSLKSLFLLDLYIKHVADDGQVVIIDEPELNLFPLNQAKMSRLMARIVNAGIKVLVTTHSDYFVREINNLIALKNVKEDKAGIMKKYGFDEEELLDYKKVSAYNTTKKYKVEKMRVDRLGIENRILDEVIEDVNEKNNEILFSVEEEQ